MRNRTGDLAILNSVQSGESTWILDWLSSPLLVGAEFLVDVHVSKRADATDRATFRVPFSALGDLCFADRIRPDGHGQWVASSRTRGVPGRVRVSSANSACRTLHAAGAPPIGIPWPHELPSNAAHKLQRDRVMTFPDPMQTDLEFCVIPCMEIVRYFFCPTRHLAESLTTGWSRLLWRPRCAVRNGEVWLGLLRDRGTSADDALWLGRYLSDPTFRDAADSVTRSFRTLNLPTAENPFQCEVPFQGTTQLQVEAIEVEAPTPLGKRYYVTRIVGAPWDPAVKTCRVRFQTDKDKVVEQPLRAPILQVRPWIDGLGAPQRPPRLVVD
jgi:hypothetical protein